MGNSNATQRREQRTVQPVPYVVAPNLSYDELVVVEANRRIEAEKQRIEAEKQWNIALAEKKRFEEDVAEKIALAKNPGHMTRAMLSAAAEESARLYKLATEEQEAKLNSIKDAMVSSGMCFEGNIHIELSIPLELYKLHHNNRTNILKKIRHVTANRDEKYVTDMDVGPDLHPYLPLYNQLVYIQCKLTLKNQQALRRGPHARTISGVFDVFEHPPTLWDDRREGKLLQNICPEHDMPAKRESCVWNDKICTTVVGTIGYKEVEGFGSRKQVRTLCWERKDKQNSEIRKKEHDIAEERRLARERDARHAKIIQDLTNGLYGDPNSECISVEDELNRIARKDLFENKENPVIFRNIMKYKCGNPSVNGDTIRGYWVYYMCIKCEHVPVNNHCIPAQHVITVHDQVITKPHDYESVLFNSVCGHKGHGGIVRNRSGFIPCWHDENA